MRKGGKDTTQIFDPTNRYTMDSTMDSTQTLSVKLESNGQTMLNEKYIGLIANPMRPIFFKNKY